MVWTLDLSGETKKVLLAQKCIEHWNTAVSLDPIPFWPCKEGCGEIPCLKCLECWNAAVGVDELTTPK